MAEYNDTTANFGFPKPHPKNIAAEDCLRIAESLDGVDGQMAAFQGILARYQSELIRLANRVSALENGGVSGGGTGSALAALPVEGSELPGGATLAPVTIVEEGELAPEGAALVLRLTQVS